MCRNLLSLLLCLLVMPALAEMPAPTTSPTHTLTPQNVEDLRHIEAQVREVAHACRDATVSIVMLGGSGSGVIVSKDGYILSAGHVVVEPGRTARVTLSDGKVVSAKALGVNNIMDSALLKIIDEGTYSFRPIGTSGNLQPGQWVFALGHPLGLQPGRPAVLRIGRLLPRFDRFLRSDCTLVAGDSGGPLFDLEGNVVGIHSRISTPTDFNMHTPVDTYIKTWDHLEAAEKIGDVPRPVIGVDGRDDGRGFRVVEVIEPGPAKDAGIEVNDFIVAIEEQPTRTRNDVIAVLSEHHAGDEVQITLVRDGKRMTVEAILESAAPQPAPPATAPSAPEGK
jgi:serine protease Do